MSAWKTLAWVVNQAVKVSSMANCCRSLCDRALVLLLEVTRASYTFVATSDKLQSCLPSQRVHAAYMNPLILQGKREKAETKHSQVLDNYGRVVCLYR